MVGALERVVADVTLVEAVLLIEADEVRIRTYGRASYGKLYVHVHNAILLECDPYSCGSDGEQTRFRYVFRRLVVVEGDFHVGLQYSNGGDHIVRHEYDPGARFVARLLRIKVYDALRLCQYGEPAGVLAKRKTNVN